MDASVISRCDDRHRRKTGRQAFDAAEVREIQMALQRDAEIVSGALIVRASEAELRLIDRDVHPGYLQRLLNVALQELRELAVTINCEVQACALPNSVLAIEGNVREVESTVTDNNVKCRCCSINHDGDAPIEEKIVIDLGITAK